MKAKNYLVLALCVAALGVGIALNNGVQSQAGETPRVRLEGAWIAKVPGTTLQWTYTVSADPSGKEAALSGSIQVAVRPAVFSNPPLFTDLEYVTPMIGRIVMTGKDTARFTAVWYGMKTAMPFDQVVFIGVNSGDIKFTAPGKSEVHHNLGFYAPGTDMDGDGLPDAGQEA